MIGQYVPRFGPMKKDEVNLVMFICNHCPYVQFRMPAISQLVRDYKGKVNIVAVNSNDSSEDTNDSSHLDHPDYMEEFTFHWGLECEYIFDEDQKLAKWYGAVCTPEFYVVGKDSIVTYHGELDSSNTNNTLEPNGSSLRHALDLTLADKDVNWKITPSFGCSIKWKE